MSVDKEGDKLESMFRAWEKRTEDRFQMLEKRITENRTATAPLNLNPGSRVVMGAPEAAGGDTCWDTSGGVHRTN